MEEFELYEVPGTHFPSKRGGLRPATFAPPPPPPSRCTKILRCAWKVFRCIFSHFILVTLVVLYCIAGALIFEALESKHELAVKSNISKIRGNITDSLWVLTQSVDVLIKKNWTDEAKLRLVHFEKEILLAIKSRGWDGSESLETQQWTFTGALFYSIIVITTIGYGHIAPKTDYGKIVTILYAILGIPLMLLCLSNIGDVMAHSFRFLYWRVCCYVCTRRPEKHRRRRQQLALLDQQTHFSRDQRPGSGIRHQRSQSARYSSQRSRTASFRRSARNSQRSADSALGLSESIVTGRSSYSDTECRYGLDRDGTANRSRMQTSLRISDPALAPQKQPPNTDAGKSAEEVFMNKYALEREESMAQKDRQRPKLKKQEESIDVESGPRPSVSETTGATLTVQRPEPAPSPRTRRGRNYKARIMSPMGFAIARQTQSSSDPELSGDYWYEDSYGYNIASENRGSGGGGGSSGGSIPDRPVPIWLCVFLVITYILCGAFLFSQWEKDWGFLNSAYFCFITLTTIGFGDYVPAQHLSREEAETTIGLCSLYLLFGIALLAMAFNLVQEEALTEIRKIAISLGILKAEHPEDSDDE